MASGFVAPPRRTRSTRSSARLATSQNARLIQCLVGCVGVLAALLGRQASALPEYVPIQEKAQGHSLTGASLLNDSLYSNPASSAFTTVYSVEGTMLMPRSFSASVLDTRTSDIGGGLGYFRKTVPWANDPMQGAKLALMGRATSSIGLGLAGKMLWGPEVSGTRAKLTDLDAGIMANMDMLQLGLTVRNLFGGNRTLDAIREWAVGARINYQNVLFFSATTISTWEVLKPYQYGFGAEYVSPYYFAIKGGYRFQPGTPDSAWSAGLSFLSPRVSFHYAVEFPQQSGVKPEHQVSTVLLF